MSAKKIVLIGASDQARHTIDIIEQSEQYQINGILDIRLPKGTLVDGYPVLGYLDAIPDLLKDPEFSGGHIAIGDNFIRRKVYLEILSDFPDFKFASVIHPSAIIGKQVSIGDGSCIMEGTIINNNTTIGMHCNLWTKSSIDHDSSMKDFSCLSPGVTTGGGVHIGECSVIGIGANILHLRTIGDHCVIGGGALVNKHIGDYEVAMGVPARVIRKRTAGERYL